MSKRISEADNIEYALSGDNRYIASVDPGEAFVVECAINANDGIVKEGIEQVGAEPAVNESVREAAKPLASLGTSLGTILEKISIPAHLTAAAVWTPIGTEGMIQTMMYGDRYGLSRPDPYSTSLMAAHRGWRDQADSVSETTKMLMMLGTYVNNNFGPRCYGKALNITRRITAAYDKALETFDLLLMPTTPMTGNEMLAVAYG